MSAIDDICIEVVAKTVGDAQSPAEQRVRALALHRASVSALVQVCGIAAAAELAALQASRLADQERRLPKGARRRT